MGLDMYFHKVQKEEVKYYRKFGELHNLIVDIAKELYGFDGDDNCQTIHINEAFAESVIERLKSRKGLDHSGFFFGGPNDDERFKDAINFMEECIEHIKKGYGIEYYAWY